MKAHRNGSYPPHSENQQSGIGFETLRLLLGEGAKVAFCGRNP
ncbi:hypothetical protein ACTXQV_45930, partial [Klebsiella pneumoniae]